MMYQNKLVAAIKVNGKVLREFKEKVYLPFGSEYSILIKNLNNVRAVVNIAIDGTEVVSGGLVVNAGQEIELKRFVNNGNMNSGNAFKFIERTESIENHRGIKLEDGLIRLEYQFEKIYSLQPAVYQPTWNSAGDYPLTKSLRGAVGGIGGQAVYSTNSVTAAVVTSQAAQTVPLNDAGITVPGSVVDQKFQTISNIFLDYQKYSMVLHLVGETEDNQPVYKPVTVKTKSKCLTCGMTNKATNKFCSECGTSLTIVA